jgi:hypothetical protein
MENSAAPTPTATTGTPTEGQPQGAPNQGGAQTGDVKAAAAEVARKLRIKFDDGNEQEVDENEVIETYRNRKRHQAVASRELNEGKMAKKQALEFVEMLKDPDKLWEVARKLGHDPRVLSEKQLARVLEDELMDPKDRELREYKAKLEKHERAEKEKEEAIKKQRLDELGQKYMKQFETEFVEALKSTPIPSTKESVGKMAAYIQKCANLGYKITALEAAKMVQQDYEAATTSIYKSASAEQLIKLLGEEKSREIQKYFASQVKNPSTVLATPAEQHRREKTPVKRMTSREWQLTKRGLK